MPLRFEVGDYIYELDRPLAIGDSVFLPAFHEVYMEESIRTVLEGLGYVCEVRQAMQGARSGYRIWRIA